MSREALWATVGLIAGPIMFVKGFRTLRTQRLIRNTPTARIRSMAMGLVEVQGAVEGRSMVSAPFSGRSCVYWEVDVSVRTRHSWNVVHRNKSGNPFYLRDETGLAMVYPKGADVRLSGWGTDETCHGLNMPACYADYLRMNPSMTLTVSRLGMLRFRERALEEGQAIYVLGSAMPRARVVTVSEGEALAATGTDGAASVVRTRDAEVVAVIRRGESERTFLISEHSEMALAAGLGWKAAAMIIGGPIATVAGLAYWLYAFASRQLPW
jgi:hypothetical protein